jgi:undecaprenyl-diphosphatase
MDPAMVKRVLELDEAVLLHLQRYRAPGVTWLMRAFTKLGDTTTGVFIALLLISMGGAAAQAGWAITLAVLLAAALTQPFKRLCRRRRPSAAIGGFSALCRDPDAFSFPSGHTSGAAAVAIVLAGQVGLGPMFCFLALGIGVSRVYLGAHYPLDVTAGAALGTLAGLAARLILGL